MGDIPKAMRMAVLASGRGSNLDALLAAIDRGDLPAEVALVVSNNSGAGALRTAAARGLAHAHVSSRTHADPDAALIDLFAAHAVDLVVLAGWMKRIDARVVAAYPDRVVNIHPAPLPRFGGAGMFGEHVHTAVLAAGVSHSGPTVHLVDEHYDHGRVLAHTPVPVQADDTPATLAARVLAAEHALYWRVLAEHFAQTRA